MTAQEVIDAQVEQTVSRLFTEIDTEINELFELAETEATRLMLHLIRLRVNALAETYKS